MPVTPECSPGSCDHDLWTCILCSHLCKLCASGCPCCPRVFCLTCIRREFGAILLCFDTSSLSHNMSPAVPRVTYVSLCLTLPVQGPFPRCSRLPLWEPFRVQGWAAVTPESIGSIPG